MIQDITAHMPQSTTQATEEVLDVEETSGMELDQPEPAEGTSPFETEMNTPQSAVTQESPTVTSSGEPIVLEVKDEQALLGSRSNRSHFLKDPLFVSSNSSMELASLSGLFTSPLCFFHK
uniref:Uncharacterized protein n=1 Tax=Parascaris equorum TaxID=6256 RepID=A0A914RN70_PAREQ